jgi:hypothetical protein
LRKTNYGQEIRGRTCLQIFGLVRYHFLWERWYVHMHIFQCSTLGFIQCYVNFNAL